MAGINIASYINVCHNADMRISLIAGNDGKIPQNSKDNANPNIIRPQDPDSSIN